MFQTLTAVIPVKEESKRLPHKNILPFGNSNLLLHKIEQLKKTQGITQIIVSTDSDEMIEMATSVGVASIRRPLEFSNEDLPFWMFCDYLAESLPNEHVMIAFVTSPMITHDLLSKSISLYFENLSNSFDSLISVCPSQNFMLDAYGPLNFVPDKERTAATWDALTGGIYMTTNMQKFYMTWRKSALTSLKRGSI